MPTKTRDARPIRRPQIKSLRVDVEGYDLEDLIDSLKRAKAKCNRATHHAYVDVEVKIVDGRSDVRVRYIEDLDY